MPVVDDVWVGVPGQEVAVAQLRSAVDQPVHAYLLAGPPGCGKRELARAFAAALLSAAATNREAASRAARLALADQHPDLIVVERAGATVRVDEARELIRLASRTPVEGTRKVIVGTGFESTEEEAAAVLLKVIEEPPASTVFILLTDDVPPELVTIASRCARIELGRLPDSAVAATLAADGVPAGVVEQAATAAGGNLERARLLATDPRLPLRRQAWFDVPVRLDDTGATVAAVVAELRSLIDDAQAPLDARHAAELAALDERVKRLGERGAGRRDLETRHKREIRRHRTDELRFGLATLAARYRDGVAEGSRGPSAFIAGVDAIHEAAEAIIRNPNEALLLQALLLKLPALR